MPGVAGEEQLAVEIQHPGGSGCSESAERGAQARLLHRGERTSGSTRDTRSPVDGSTVIVVPRASLLWIHSRRSRTPRWDASGAKTSDAFGLTMPAVRFPEFSALSLETSNE